VRDLSRITTQRQARTLFNLEVIP